MTTMMLIALTVAVGAPGAQSRAPRTREYDRIVELVGESPGFDVPVVTDPRQRVAGLIEVLAREIADPSEAPPGLLADWTSGKSRANLVSYLGNPIGYLGTRGLCPPELVREAYLNTRHLELRRHLAIAVVKSGQGRDLAGVAAVAALYDPEPWMRQIALRALAEYRDPTFLRVFLQALSDPFESAHRVREVALQAHCGLLGLGYRGHWEGKRYELRDRRGRLAYVVDTKTRAIERVGPQVASAKATAVKRPGGQGKRAPSRSAPARRTRR